MTIASQIAALQQDKSNIATAISAKGGTVNSGDGFDDFATAIATIPTGGPGITREVTAQGKFQMPTTSFTFSLPSNVTDIGNYALYYGFYNYCTGLTSIDLSSLTTVSGNYAFNYAFGYCTNLTTANISSLTTITGSNAFDSAFYNCTGLASISFPALTNMTASYAFRNAFNYCTNLTNIYFPALTTTSFGTSYTNQFYRMMRYTGTSKNHTIHFPSNLESTISKLSEYPLFSGTSGYVTLVYDLPATS